MRVRVDPDPVLDTEGHPSLDANHYGLCQPREFRESQKNIFTLATQNSAELSVAMAKPMLAIGNGFDALDRDELFRPSQP